MLDRYEEELEKFLAYYEELLQFLAAGEEEVEEELEEEEFEIEVPITTRIETIARTLEAIRARIEWLESLKANPEERARVSGITGIELTVEMLDAIIEGAKSEAQMFEQQMQQLQQGTEAQAAPVFTAEARDYEDFRYVAYVPELLSLDGPQLAMSERWY